MYCILLAWMFLCGYFIRNTTSLNVTISGCPIFYREKCNPNMVRFFFTAPDTATYELLHPEYKLPDSYDPGKPLKIIIHGFGNLNYDRVSLKIRQVYNDSGKTNILLVDWTALSAGPCYPGAAVNTAHVGQCTGEMLINIRRYGISYKQMHIIGYSLGAHIAGFTGNFLEHITGLSIARITGLDPALPLFTTTDKNFKLDQTDADFVDIIHTSAGTYGKVEATGHVDFYVNGGTLQPTCREDGVLSTTICSHSMSGFYYAESISGPKQFIGVTCPNLFQYYFGWCKNSMESAVMGEDANYKSRGTYYLDTALDPPYALGYNIFRPSNSS